MAHQKQQQTNTHYQSTMTNINTNNAFVALPVDLHREVWKFLVDLDPRNDMTTMDYKTVASFMVTHKQAKETLISLDRWKVCANALYQTCLDGFFFATIRDRERLLCICRLLCTMTDGDIRQGGSSLSRLNDKVVAPWFREGVCVKVLDDESGWYESGVIKEIISDTSATVDFGESMKCMPLGDMEIIQPRVYDRVLVACGSEAGMEGELVYVDGTDAIIKDSNEEFKIVHHGHLARIKIDVFGGDDL